MRAVLPLRASDIIATNTDAVGAAETSTAVTWPEIVTEVFAANPELGPWRCAEIPGFLLITREPDEILDRWANKVRRQSAQLALILPPPGLITHPGEMIMVVLFKRELAPMTIVGGVTVQGPTRIYSQAESLVVAVNILAEMRSAPTSTSASTQPRRAGLQRPPTPNRERTLAAIYYSDRMRFDPAIPVWLRDGLSTLYSFAWCSENELHVRPGPFMMKRSAISSHLLSTRELFASTAVPRDREKFPAWLATAQLFVWWSLIEDETRRESFWKFVHAASTAPADEKLLKQHFGLGCDELDEALQNLREVERGPFDVSLKTSAPASLPEIPLRNATLDEIEMLRNRLNNAVRRRPYAG